MITPFDAAGPDVLIVDAQGESSEVLSTVLQRRGLRTAKTTSPGEGITLIESFPCHVAVVEMEDDASTTEIELRFRQLTLEKQMGLVLLGSVAGRAENEPSIRRVDKPYRFDQLIRTIEELVQSSQTAE